jgi:hypothetical protein
MKIIQIKIMGVYLMKCECGGILLVKRVEPYPEGLKDKMGYQRVCDVECVNCGREYFSQPYDWGKRINEVKDLEKPI